MAFVGVSLRNTSGYVTDPSGVTYCLGEVYPTTRGGLTFGWASSLVANSRNRNASIDARLAGCNFVVNSGATNTFTLDLPNGPGTYRVRLAIGDYGSAQNNLVLVKDGSTTLATINVATSANRFTDAASTGSGVGGLTDTGWVSGNVDVELTFSGSTIALVCGGHSAATLSSAIAHVAVEFVSGGGGGTASPVSSSGSSTVSAVGGSLAESAPTASAGTATVSAVGGTLTVITSSAFKNNTGTVLASLTDVTAWVYNPTTGALVVKLTGQTTNGSGVLTLNDAAIVSATTYRVVYRNEDDGAEGMETVTAS